MRATTWVLGVVLIGMSGPVVGYEPPCASCNGGLAAGPAVQRGLDAGPCAGPIGYCLTPGCCEHTRRCCDNAWAGYCEHRAKVEACCANAGNHCRRACRQAPMAYSGCDGPNSNGALQPTPAVPAPAPAPAPHAPPTKLGQNDGLGLR
jgi:hypothetical protein